MYWLFFWIWGVLAVWASIKGHRILRNHSESSVKWIIGVGILSFFIFGIAGVQGGDFGSWPYQAVAAALSWYGILGIIEFIHRAAVQDALPKVQAKLDTDKKERLRKIQQERLARLQEERRNAAKQADTRGQEPQTSDAYSAALSHDELVRISSIEQDIHDAAAQSKQAAIDDLLRASDRSNLEPTAVDLLRSVGNEEDAVEISGHSQYLNKLKRLLPIHGEAANGPTRKAVTQADDPVITNTRHRLVQVLSRRAKAGLEDSTRLQAEATTGAVTLSGEIQSRFGGAVVKTLPVSTGTANLEQPAEEQAPKTAVSAAGGLTAPGTEGRRFTDGGKGRFSYQPRLVVSKLGSPEDRKAPGE